MWSISICLLFLTIKPNCSKRSWENSGRQNEQKKWEKRGSLIMQLLFPSSRDVRKELLPLEYAGVNKKKNKKNKCFRVGSPKTHIIRGRVDILKTLGSYLKYN